MRGSTVETATHQAAEVSDDEFLEVSPEADQPRVPKLKKKKKKVAKTLVMLDSAEVIDIQETQCDPEDKSQANKQGQDSNFRLFNGEHGEDDAEDFEDLDVVAMHRKDLRKIFMKGYQDLFGAVMQRTAALEASLAVGTPRAPQHPNGMEAPVSNAASLMRPEQSAAVDGFSKHNCHIATCHKRRATAVQEGMFRNNLNNLNMNRRPTAVRNSHRSAGLVSGMVHKMEEVVDHEFHGTVGHSRQSEAVSDAISKGLDWLTDEDAVEVKQPKGMFADASAMKAQMRDAITHEIYEVSTHYWERGVAQNIAKSILFEHVTLFVIGINALWIAVDVDHNKAASIADADPVFVYADNLFCTYFCFEWTVRFCAFRIKNDCLHDRWFVFDSFMCALMAFETWLLPLILLIAGGGSAAGGSLGDASLLKGFRMLRLLRMARVIRLLNALPELMVLIKGLRVALRAVSATVLLLLMIIYVFAVGFRQLTDGTELGDNTFTSVPRSMQILLVQGTMPDLYDAIMPIWEFNDFYAVVFLLFVLIVSITVMNMLVGVLVGVVNTVATIEKEQLMVHFVKTNLLELMDQDEDGQISRKEFDDLMQIPLAIRSLDQMGVDVMGLVDLADFIFPDKEKDPTASTSGASEGISIGDFFELIMQLRGDNQATVKDIVDLRKCVTIGLANLREDMQAMGVVGGLAIHHEPSVVHFNRRVRSQATRGLSRQLTK